jgi:hypothetical protein
MPLKIKQVKKAVSNQYQELKKGIVRSGAKYLRNALYDVDQRKGIDLITRWQ